MDPVFLFPGGKPKALTFSYDDGVIFDRRLVEIFNKNGMKGTFNLNSGSFGLGRRLPESEIKSLYEGHEIACHGVKHLPLAKMPLMSIVEDVLQDRRNLERVTGRIIRGMAYAYGSWSPAVTETLKNLGIVYSRIVASTQTFGIPENFLAWEPTCHHFCNLSALGDKFLALKSHFPLSLMYVWGHSYEFNDYNNWNVIEEFCEKMSGKEEIWYATNMEIYEYVMAIRSFVTSADGTILYNPSAVPVWCRCGEKSYVVKAGETVVAE